MITLEETHIHKGQRSQATGVSYLSGADGPERPRPGEKPPQLEQPLIKKGNA